MIRKLLFGMSMLGTLAYNATMAQEGMSIGKGGAAPNKYSKFEVVANDKGILIPRLTKIEIDQIIPDGTADGLLVYNKTSGAFEYFNGVEWISLLPKLDPKLSVSGNILHIDVNGNGTENVEIPQPELRYEQSEYALYYNGTKISLANLTTGPEGDTDPTNEFQNLTVRNDSVLISNGLGAKLPAGITGGSDDQALSYDAVTYILTLEDGGSADLSALASDADSDPTNEIQTLSISNDTIYLTNSTPIKLPAGTGGNDADADPANELQDLSIKNDSILISNGKGIKLPAGVTAVDDQALTFDDATNILSLENGGDVDLTKFLTGADADADSTNELQNLSIKNDSILISGGQGIKLPSGTISTDDQILSFDASTHTLSLEDGGDIDLSIYDHSQDFDTDSTNELQTLTYTNDTLYLSKGNKVEIIANTDKQQLALDETTNTLSLDNSTDVDLSKYDQSADLDADPANEIQTISFANDTIYLSQDGGKIKFSEQETDPIWIADQGNYYTKTNVETSGEASIHWDNLTNLPANLDTDATDDFSGDYTDLTNQPTASLTDNQVPHWDGTNLTLADGLITDDGTNVSIGGAINTSYLLFVNGKFGSAGINELSDRRFKTDIQHFETSLDKVCQLQAVTYEWRKDEFPERNFSDGTEIGFIAQEVEKYFPELVTTGDDGYKTVQYSRTVVVLLEAIKELNEIVQNQQQTITKLEASVENMDEMNQRLDILQKQVNLLNQFLGAQTDTANQ